MATLALAFAGQAIGASIGGTVLGLSAAAIGGMVGSTVGSMVDSWIISSLAPAQRIEGARLESLRVEARVEVEACLDEALAQHVRALVDQGAQPQRLQAHLQRAVLDA